MKKIIIAAITEDYVLGKRGSGMLWYDEDELNHFKKLTYNYPVLMGRKTFETLKSPLRGRENIVLSRNPQYDPGIKEVLIYNNIEEVFFDFERKEQSKIFIIGGEEIFTQTLFFADEMILSFMKIKAGGDIYFPSFNLTDWMIADIERYDSFEVRKYLRKNFTQ